MTTYVALRANQLTPLTEAQGDGNFSTLANGIDSITSNLAAGTGSSLIGNIQSSTGSVVRTVNAKLQEMVSVLDFGADPTGVADSTAAFNAAGAAVSVVEIPAGGNYILLGTPVGTFVNKGSKINGFQYYGTASPYIATTLQQDTTQPGSLWQSQYHANWNVVETLVPDNPTEWQVYSGSSGGCCHHRIRDKSDKLGERCAV